MDRRLLEAAEQAHAAVREAYTLGYEAGHSTGRLSRPFFAPDPQHAAPTYISGSSDRVYLISEMPTRYIRNVVRMDCTRQTVGLRRVLTAELTRRGEWL